MTYCSSCAAKDTEIAQLTEEAAAASRGIDQLNAIRNAELQMLQAEIAHLKAENERLKKLANDYRMESNIQRDRNHELDHAHKRLKSDHRAAISRLAALQQGGS